MKKFFLLFAIFIFIFAFSNAEASQLFWSDNSLSKIQTTKLDSISVSDVVTGTTAFNVAVDTVNGKLLWTEQGSTLIKRANLDGSSVESSFLNVGAGNDPRGLSVSSTHLYYTRPSPTTVIGRNNLNDGTGQTTLVSGVGTDPFSMALDLTNGKIYWGDSSLSRLSRSNLDGSGVEAAFLNLGYLPHDIAVDEKNSQLYWADVSNNRIFKSNLDGTGASAIMTGLSSPVALTLNPDLGKLYVVNNGTGSIIEANLDGTGSSTLVSGLTSPVYIDFLDTEAGTGVLKEFLNNDTGKVDSISFGEVTAEGVTSRTNSSQGTIDSMLADSSVGALMTDFVFDVTSTATLNAGAGMTFNLSYSQAAFDAQIAPLGYTESMLEIFHFDGFSVTEATNLSIDTLNNTISGQFATASLSDFGVGVNPEPATLFLLLSSLLGTFFRFRKKW